MKGGGGPSLMEFGNGIFFLPGQGAIKKKFLRTWKAENLMKIFLSLELLSGLIIIGIAKNEAQSCYEIAKYF